LKGQNRIRVVGIDDDLTLLKCLEFEMRHSTSLAWIGSFDSFETAIAGAAIHRMRPDVLLLDITIPGGLDGLDACRQIKRELPRLKVIILSASAVPERIFSAFESEADGYLVKTRTPRQVLATAIARVHGGRPAISPEVAEELILFFRRRTPLLGRLSPQEKRILSELERGKTYKETAAEIGLSENTLKTHVKSILVKTGASSIAQAAWIRRQAVH